MEPIPQRPTQLRSRRSADRRGSERGFQWYGLAARALDLLDGDEVLQALLDGYSQYPLASDLRAMRGDFGEFAP